MDVANEVNVDHLSNITGPQIRRKGYPLWSDIYNPNRIFYFLFSWTRFVVIPKMGSLFRLKNCIPCKATINTYMGRYNRKCINRRLHHVLTSANVCFHTLLDLWRCVQHRKYSSVSSFCALFVYLLCIFYWACWAYWGSDSGSGGGFFLWEGNFSSPLSLLSCLMRFRTDMKQKTRVD